LDDVHCELRIRHGFLAGTGEKSQRAEFSGRPRAREPPNVHRVKGRTSAAAEHGGRMVVYDVQASIILNPGEESPPSGGGASRGWAHQRLTGEEYRNGAGQGEDWRDVLDRWLYGGEWTVGWEIWVDGEMACDAQGNET
jgi:hypothetical protein